MHDLGLLSHNPIKNVIFNTIVTLSLAITVGYVFNLFKFGKYIVGGIEKLTTLPFIKVTKIILWIKIKNEELYLIFKIKRLS